MEAGNRIQTYRGEVNRLFVRKKVLLGMSDYMENYYELLGVDPKASTEEIHRAYLALAKKYHPDTTSLPRAEAEKKMALLQEAYSELANPYQRETYDYLLEVGDPFENEVFLDNEEEYCVNAYAGPCIIMPHGC